MSPLSDFFNRQSVNRIAKTMQVDITNTGGNTGLNFGWIVFQLTLLKNRSDRVVFIVNPYFEESTQLLELAS